MHATSLVIAAPLITARAPSDAPDVLPIELVARDETPLAERTLPAPTPRLVKPRREVVERASAETVIPPKLVSRPEALDVPAVPPSATPGSAPMAPTIAEPPLTPVAPSTVDAPTGDAVAMSARGYATVPAESGGVKTDGLPAGEVGIAPESGGSGRRGEGLPASGTAHGVAGVARDSSEGLTSFARPTGGYQTRPRYPETARRAGVEGVTLLRFVVLADGRVGDVLVEHSAGHGDLDGAAIAAVRTWRFEPARRGSEAVAVWVTLPVRFELRER